MRLIGPLGLAIALAATNGMCHAQPAGAYVPDFNVAMPYYWSGTNARAIGNLYVYPPLPLLPPPGLKMHSCG